MEVHIPTLRPNLYQLSAPNLVIQYALSGIDGRPHFSYSGIFHTANFAGDQIHAEQTALGTLITVKLQEAPDLGTTTFSMLLPIVQLQNETEVAQVNTIGIHSRVRTSNVPATLHGQLQMVETVPLHGTGRSVVF